MSNSTCYFAGWSDLGPFESTLKEATSSSNALPAQGYEYNEPWLPERLEMSFERKGSSWPWFDDVVNRVVYLAGLGTNWNGYGESRPHPSSGKRVVRILQAIDYRGPAPTVVPLSDGGMQVEWHGAVGDIEIEVPPSGPATAWVSMNSDEDWLVDRHHGVDRLRKAVETFMAG